MPYQNSFTTLKQKLFQVNTSSVNQSIQQSISWIKLIEWDWQYYSRGTSNVHKKPHSRFTRSIYTDWLSNKQETRRPKETQFSREKKYSIKGKMHSLWTPKNITSLDGLCYEVIDSLISHNIFSYFKMFSMQCRKTLQLKTTKKE